MIDFHSHILPSVDHGAASLEISVQMLEQAKKAGVTTIVATPHFYLHKDSLDAFLERRNAASDLLKNYIAQNSRFNIEIRAAAEVALENKLLSQDLRKLAIEGTNSILIEMPLFGRWHSWMYEMLYDIESQFKLDVIIAHIDRYPKENIPRLLEMGFTTQINADSLVKGSFFEKRRMRALCNNRFAHLIGSDAHDTVERNYENLISASRKLPSSLLTYFVQNAKDILT